MIRIPDLVRETAALRMPALALTELGNLYSMVKFYRAAINAGVKPIIGVDVWIANGKQTNQPYPLVLLNGIPVNVGLLYYAYLDQSISLIALGVGWLFSGLGALLLRRKLPLLAPIVNTALFGSLFIVPQLL